MKKDGRRDGAHAGGYLSFARGDLGESSAPTDMAAFLEELRVDAERHGHKASVVFHGPPIVTVRPAAFKRCLANLVSNARALRALDRHHRPSRPPLSHRHGGRRRTGQFGRAARGGVQAVPRLDDARNQRKARTAWGLAIARDIARSHGGDIMLGDSPLGGLRATVRVPV